MGKFKQDLMTTLELKARLFKGFGGFADGRIKDLNKSDLFIADDRQNAARDARGKLFLWYCTVNVRVLDGHHVRVELGNAMPRSDAVTAWWDANKSEGPYGLESILVANGEQGKLKELAKLIAEITKKPYREKAYTYVCPEVAATLLRITKTLDEAWKEQGRF